MNLEMIIKIMENKLTNLRNAKLMAENNGQLDAVVAMEAEILETENTLTQLKSA
jgi:hypothetical protein